MDLLLKIGGPVLAILIGITAGVLARRRGILTYVGLALAAFLASTAAMFYFFFWRTVAILVFPDRFFLAPDIISAAVSAAFSGYGETFLPIMATEALMPTGLSFWVGTLVGGRGSRPKAVGLSDPKGTQLGDLDG